MFHCKFVRSKSQADRRQIAASQHNSKDRTAAVRCSYDRRTGPTNSQSYRKRIRMAAIRIRTAAVQIRTAAVLICQTFLRLSYDPFEFVRLPCDCRTTAVRCSCVCHKNSQNAFLCMYFCMLAFSKHRRLLTFTFSWQNIIDLMF